jgi:hypothetical protein
MATSTAENAESSARKLACVALPRQTPINAPQELAESEVKGMYEKMVPASPRLFGHPLRYESHSPEQPITLGAIHLLHLAYGQIPLSVLAHRARHRPRSRTKGGAAANPQTCVPADASEIGITN